MSAKNPNNNRLLVCDCCGRKAENVEMNKRIANAVKANSGLRESLRKALWQMDAFNERGVRLEDERNELVIIIGLMIKQLGTFRLHMRDFLAVRTGNAPAPRFRRDIREALIQVADDPDGKDMVISHVEAPPAPEVPVVTRLHEEIYHHFREYTDKPLLCVPAEIIEGPYDDCPHRMLESLDMVIELERAPYMAWYEQRTAVNVSAEEVEDEG